MTIHRVPFFDRTRIDPAHEAELASAFLRVLRSGRYILGDEVESFERACAARLDARHAIGVSSGSDALLVALLALGIGRGDEVVCPAYTFFATAGAIVRAGATPVFADIDPTTFAITPDDVARALSPKTRAVIVVHLFGRTADVAAIARAAPSLPILEDAAQAFGAESAGTRGALGCFSFFPTKNLAGFGDGGLVTTNDAALSHRARALRSHGAASKHHHTMIGGNFRLDALHAALLSVELPRIDARVARQRAHATRYAALFEAAGLARTRLDVPEIIEGATFNPYVIRVPGDGVRDRLRAFLTESGVGTEVYYPTPLHRQPCFAALDTPSLPIAEAASRETLALPIFPELLDEEVAYVVDRIAAFFEA